MAVVTFKFNDNEITFDFNHENLKVNATQMAKVFNAQVNEFLSNQATKSFIEACLKNGNSRFLAIEKEEDLVTSIQKSGTWMHRVLALKFAAWLDPNFELWVYSTIDKIVFGDYQFLKKSLRESAERKAKIDTLREALRDDQSFSELERLELEERQAAYSRGKFNKTQIGLFGND